jgi:hypothetical protein
MEQQTQSCSTILTISGTEYEPQGDVTLPPAEGSLGDPPDLSLSVTSLGGPLDMDSGISINVGVEAGLGESPQSQWRQPAQLHPLS